MFGGQASTPFGASQGGFGQANSAPAFGSPAPAPFGAPASSGGFGGFGAPSPAPAPSGFGGFGAPAAAPVGGFGGFGAPAPAPSGFGSSVGGFGAAPAPSLFGTPAPAPGGLFGSNPAPSPGGLFGTSSVSSFGGGGGGGFGSAPAATFGGGGAFGAPPPAPTGLFLGSSPAPAPTGYGSSGFGAGTSGAFGSPAPPPPSSGLFGAPAPAPSTGMFGAPTTLPAGGTAGGGTKIQPYQVTNRQDGTSNISLQAITGMPAYENKSFEELRFEDYSQGNRGSGGAPPPTAAGGFGASGGFGAPAPAPSGGLFGAPTPVSAFGTPAPAPTGFGFGSPSPAPALFGAPTPAPFGAPAPALFGSPSPAPFGAPTPTPGAFGVSAFGMAKPPASGGLFGSSAPAPGGLFGSMPAPATGGGLFGSNPAPAPGAFGAPAPAGGGGGGGLFGAPAPAPFGAPAPAFGGGFGAPALGPPSGSLFGGPAPGGAFGAPSQGGGLFGAPAPSGTGTSSLFGPPKPPNTGLFGAPSPAPPAPYAYGAPPQATAWAPSPYAMPPPPPMGAVIPPANDELLAAQVAALEKSRRELDSNDTFRKKSSDSATVSGSSLAERDIVALLPLRTPYPTYRASPKSNARIRPRGFASPEKTPTPSLSRLGNGGKPMATPDRMAALSATRLVINPSPKPKLKLSLHPSNATSPLKLTNDAAQSHHPGLGSAPTQVQPTSPAASMVAENAVNGSSKEGHAYYRRVVGQDEARANAADQENVTPTLTKAGYTCTPSIEVLATLSAADLAAVSNFSVERAGVGKIEWEGAVDIRGTDLDQVVVIEPKSASVYLEEEEKGAKPVVGTKLNRSAVITLQSVYPPKATLESQQNFSKKVERQTKKAGAELISYDCVSGIWKLRVQHFSRYALDDDDDDSSSDVDTETKSRVHFESGNVRIRPQALDGVELVRRQATPFKIRPNVVALVEDDDMEDAWDITTTTESKIIVEAESAFVAIKTRSKDHSVRGRMLREESAPFREESVPAAPAKTGLSRYIPSTTDLVDAARRGSVCQTIYQAKGPSTDFGLRMGRSFRVGWRPDGSFYSRKKNGTLVRCVPHFSDDMRAKEDSLKYLKEHRVGVICSKVGGNECAGLRLPSDSSLTSVLSSYVDVAPRRNKGSFALVKALTSGVPGSMLGETMTLDHEEFVMKDIDIRQIIAVKRWLIESCREDVDDEVKKALAKGSEVAAILSAVSGGNVEKACEIACELGFSTFSNLLCVGPESKSDILAEALSSQLPEELHRAFLLIGGDMKKEEEIYKNRKSSFDWRRRLAMSLTYSKHRGTTLASLLADYHDKIRQGLAPFPKPDGGEHTSDVGVENACFRILCFGAKVGGTSLQLIADPRGHGSSIHDYATSFHIASAVAATTFALPMSPVDAQVLTEGYSSQLLAEGQWEWSVYILLCSLGTKAEQDFLWSQGLAKELVLRNFRTHMTTQRKFLEGVGVPSVWFEEALALQCSGDGDLVGYLSHMVKVNPNDACLSLESTLIPTMLFLNKSALAEARMVLDAFSGNEDSLASAVNDMFSIYEEILRLERPSCGDIDEMAPSLLERCERVEKTLVSYHEGAMKLHAHSLRLIPATKTVPVAYFLAESLSQISLFKLRLRAMLSRTSPVNTQSLFLDIEHSEDMRSGGISGRENFLRWLL